MSRREVAYEAVCLGPEPKAIVLRVGDRDPWSTYATLLAAPWLLATTRTTRA